MFGKRGENLHVIYVLLFLNVAFFFLEYQDTEKYARLFSFDAPHFFGGEFWRVLTYQFSQAGQGWFFIPKPLALFFTLLILYIMGAAVEEELGTFHLMMLFACSTIGSAALASLLGVALLGSYFVTYSLLFVYAAIFPQQTFYLFAVLPIRVRWLAYISGAVLAIGVVVYGGANTAAFAGALVAFVYYLIVREPDIVIQQPKPGSSPSGIDRTAVHNAARFVAIKRALAAGNQSEIDRLNQLCEKEIVRGVNICPPIDYKPENADGYCIRCEGFAECSARYLKLNRPSPKVESRSAPMPEPTA